MTDPQNPYDPFNLFATNTHLDAVTVGGTTLRTGDRVRIRPRRRADAFDLMLDGKTAVVEAIEQDVEDRLYVALVLDDDPGRDLGLARQPGHRFFYALDDVEPLTDDEPA